MLVLRRKAGEAIVLNGVITIHVLAVEGERVKLGISAPPEVVIVRSELLEGPGAGMGMPGGAAQGGPMAPHREPRPYREPERPYREPERPYREPERPYREPNLNRDTTRGPDEGGEESRRGQGMPQEPNRYGYGERPRPFGYGERPRPFGERNLPTSIGSGPLHRE
ncbi:MAG TPA: carbon storage regulator [Ktedonobacterales bacterium]|jgi:carbon storage regulator|nr:carbon storage regulator [Ktedonobacterales bacterium]